jgi:hypothetical protein
LQAEAQFVIRQITQTLDKYYLVMSALSELQVDMVSRVMKAKPDQESYGQQKAALVASHTMMDYQKVDKLMAMEPLGGRKTTELLAAMQKLRPPQDEAFFAWAFIQRLPLEVRVLLAQDDTSDMRKFVALHQPQHHDVTAVAAVGPTVESIPAAVEETVAAPLRAERARAVGAARNSRRAADATAVSCRSTFISPPSAISMLGMGRRLTSVWNNAPGRKTSRPGRDQRRYRVQHQVLGRHGIQL